VVPGRYEVDLTVNGQKLHESIVVKPDPRVPASNADLQAQLDLALQIVDGMSSSYMSYNQIVSLRSALDERQKSLQGKAAVKELSDGLSALTKELAQLADGTNSSTGFGNVHRNLARYLSMIEFGDMRPASSAQQNTMIACEELGKSSRRWAVVNSETLPALNQLLERNGLARLPTVTVPTRTACTIQ